jgi:acid phosphatase family membrane protein YuiD
MVGVIVGMSSGVGVDAGLAADFAVSVKFAITVCAAAVWIRDTLGVGAAGVAGMHAASKNVPIHAMKNILVFMVVLLFFYRSLLL